MCEVFWRLCDCDVSRVVIDVMVVLVDIAPVVDAAFDSSDKDIVEKLGIDRESRVDSCEV